MIEKLLMKINTSVKMILDYKMTQENNEHQSDEVFCNYPFTNFLKNFKYILNTSR